MLDDGEYNIRILSNITTSQINEILEFTLRSGYIPARVESGDYDNILQDSQKYSDSNVVIIFWELCNIIDGFHYKYRYFLRSIVFYIPIYINQSNWYASCIFVLN